MIYRPIIIIIVLEERECPLRHFRYYTRGQRIGGRHTIDEMRQNIPYTFKDVQIVHQNIIYCIAECGDRHLRMVRHFFDNRITNRIEYIDGDLFRLRYQRKRREFLDIYDRVRINRFRNLGNSHHVRSRNGRLAFEYSQQFRLLWFRNRNNLTAVQYIIR